MLPDKYKKLVSDTGQAQWLNRKSNVDAFISELNNIFKKKNNLLVLDAGCANGRDSNEISSQGYNVIGIDTDSKFLKDAKNNYPQIQFKKMNIEKLKFSNETFDSVYCVNTLFYTNPVVSLPELARVLKINGLMFITLDSRIFDLDKNKEIHTLDIEKTIKSLNSFKVLKKEPLERIDLMPFKHKHFFYEIALQKVK